MKTGFIVLLLMCWFQAAIALDHEMDLFHWTVSSGLPDNHITCIEQDDKGFIWMGTSKGLVRFDGYEFLLFELPKCHTNEWISAIYKKNQELFLLTNRKGNYIFDTQRLQCVKVDKAELLANNKYTKQDLSLFFEEGIISNDSVAVFLKPDGKLTVDEQLVSGTFNSVCQDSDGTIWVGSATKGLGYLNDQNTAITYVGDLSQMPDVAVNSIAEAPDGAMWFEIPLGSVGFWDGSNLVSVKNIADYPNLRNGYPVLSSLVDFNMTTLFFDATGNLWIGTTGNGLFRIRFKPQYFQFYKFDYRSSAGLAHKDVSYPLVTNNGDIWIGTWGGGINILKKEKIPAFDPKFSTITPQPGKKGALQKGMVFPLLEDRKGNLWLGTNGSGVQFIDRKAINAGDYWFKHYERKGGTIPSDSIWALCEDKTGGIWVGTMKGLARYLPQENRFENSFSELNDSTIFQGKEILMLYEGEAAKLWISTRYNGLFCWNRSNNQLKQYLNGGEESLNGVLCVSMMPDSSMWFGGINGLFYFDRHTDHFSSLNKIVDLPSYHIESMLAGHDDRLWLGTGKGLTALDPSNHTAEVYRMPGGVMSNSFTQGASKDKAGYLHFGSRNGFYRFHPSDLKNKPRENPIVLTNFEIHGADFREDSVLFTEGFRSIDIASVDHLRLRHHQNTITIGYRYLDYSPNDFQEYELLMEGLDSEWTSTFDTNRTWSNLSPGEYIFHVRVKGQSREVVLPITIASPWWTGVWVVVVSVVLLAGLMMLLLRYSNKRVREKEKQHQKERYDRLRFRFFLNISHEIRTPLTLIKGGIDRLIENKAVDNDYLEEVNRVQRNTQRLTHMVNEVLDLKKMENTQVSVNKSDFNLKEFLEASVDVFRLRDESSHLILKMPESPVWVFSDRELMETIVYNLLSNALKYSSPPSEIVVELVYHQNESVAISVSDQGVGIIKEEQQLIFERFYRSENQKETGTGIGLAVVKQYAGLLGGTITVQSEPGQGSIFILLLPDNAKETDDSLQAKEGVLPQNKEEGDKPVLVLVDDQPEIRSFVRELFENEYTIFEASNGQIALTLIKEKNPDLIISDVMMPVMNGYELCAAVRDDIQTCHIPLILLTAKTGDEAQMNAFECKADAFINKPFNQNILRLRVDKLIEQRRQLIQKYGKQPEEKTTMLATNLLDKAFLEKMEGILKEKLADEGFKVEELAFYMAMSTSGLYRKIKSLTDQSPVEYIRVFRLKIAANRLRETSCSVTEIAEETGFSTQKYFSKCFKQQFGMTPLNYRKAIRTTG